MSYSIEIMAQAEEQVPLTTGGTGEHGEKPETIDPADLRLARNQDWETERARRIYRGVTIAMLRKYMRYSHDVGRLPSLVGREFFRSKVSKYTMVTFEDRVIFAHDMERCLDRLDEFSRQVIARHILQEYDQQETAKLLNCGVRTIRTWVPLALDLLSEILLEVGLMERLGSKSRKPCQVGTKRKNSVSCCENGKNNF